MTSLMPEMVLTFLVSLTEQSFWEPASQPPPAAVQHAGLQGLPVCQPCPDAHKCRIAPNTMEATSEVRPTEGLSLHPVDGEAAAAAADLLTPDGGATEGDEDAQAAAEAESIAPGTANAEARAAMDAVVEQLQQCVSKDQCDAVAVAFCYANNKAARKRMVRWNHAA